MRATATRTNATYLIINSYFTLVLKEIANRNPDIVFKGGTPLSKCYKIIDRFSEDIDLNITGDTKPGESKRKNLKAHIVDAIEYCKLTLTEPETIRSSHWLIKLLLP